MLNLAKKIVILPRYPALWAIRLYQNTISPDHGPMAKGVFPNGYCPFYPSCSEYGYQSIYKFGLFKGILKTSWRVLRCHPWTQGGVDAP